MAISQGPIKDISIYSVQLFFAGVVFSGLPARYFVNKNSAFFTVLILNLLLIGIFLNDFDFSKYLEFDAKLMISTNIALIFACISSKFCMTWIANNQMRISQFLAKNYTKNMKNEKSIFFEFLNSETFECCFGFFIFSILLAVFMILPFSILILI